MTKIRSPKKAKKEIKDYLSGALLHPKVVINIKKTYRIKKGESDLKKIREKHKKAERYHKLWLKETREANEMLHEALKRVRLSKKLIKLYYRGKDSVIAAFTEDISFGRSDSKKKK